MNFGDQIDVSRFKYYKATVDLNISIFERNNWRIHIKLKMIA